MSMLYDFSYQSSSGNVYYGQVAADPGTKYNYTSGQTIQSNGGTYTIYQPVHQTNAPAGSVYCTAYYDKATDKTYDSYHYDVAKNQYYDVTKNYYDPAAKGTYQGVSMAAGTQGLGSEYDYAKGPDGKYHVYGGGGEAHAQITPSTVGTHDYDYKFTYQDGSYYTGKVTDDGSLGYSAGYTKATPYGTYSITGVDTTAPSPTEMAGYVYTNSYYDASTAKSYTPYSETPGTPYYNKPDGYGGLGTEKDYAHYSNGYHQYGGGQYEASSTPALMAVPPLT
jgi:hypothetical protein